MIEIDNRNIFFDKLKTGINLFKTHYLLRKEE